MTSRRDRRTNEQIQKDELREKLELEKFEFIETLNTGEISPESFKLYFSKALAQSVNVIGFFLNKEFLDMIKENLEWIDSHCSESDDEDEKDLWKDEEA